MAEERKTTKRDKFFSTSLKEVAISFGHARGTQFALNTLTQDIPT